MFDHSACCIAEKLPFDYRHALENKMQHEVPFLMHGHRDSLIVVFTSSYISILISCIIQSSI